jgi:hypothetical protein
MGRPIGRRYFGPLNTTSDTTDPQGHTLTSTSLYNVKQRGYNIPVERAKVTGGVLDIGGEGEASTPYIIAQRGTRRYRVMTADGAGVCYLVNPALYDDSTANPSGRNAAWPTGAMAIAGYLNADDGSSPIYLQKITKHYAVDWSGNRYKWFVTPYTGVDSTIANKLILIAATTTTISSGNSQGKI